MSAPTLEPRTHAVTIFQGPDQSKLVELAEKVEDLRNVEEPEVSLLSDASAWVAAAEEHDVFLAEATERAIVVTLRPLGRRKFRDLVDAHPPKSDSEEDAQLGVNITPFAEELVPLSIESPEMSDAEKEEFLDSVTDAQFDQLFTVAFQLNRNLSAPPKAIAPSSLSQSGAAT